MIAFRVDSNGAIGTGHVMRCMAIAKELCQLGCVPLFVTVSEATAQLLAQYHFECIRIEGVFDDLLPEREQLQAILERRRVRLLLLDTYFATQPYIDALRTSNRVGLIYDFGTIAPVDLFINYTLS